MRIGGTLAFWVKAAGVVLALYVLWRLYGFATIGARAIAAVATKVGEVVSEAGEVVVRPSSTAEGEGSSAPGYGP